MYHVILAATPQEANTYAQRAKLPRGRTRYVVRAASIRGLRLAKIHELPSYASRPDRHAIEAVLRYSKGERELVEMPEAPRPSLEESYEALEHEVGLLTFAVLKDVEGRDGLVAEAMVVDGFERARAHSTHAADQLHLALVLEGHENLLQAEFQRLLANLEDEIVSSEQIDAEMEAARGAKAGTTEPSEDPAPAPQIESPAAERSKRKPAPQAKPKPAKPAAPEFF